MQEVRVLNLLWYEFGLDSEGKPCSQESDQRLADSYTEMKRFDFTNKFTLRKLYNLKLIIPERSLFDLQVLLVVVAVVEEQLGKGLCLIGLDHPVEQRSLLDRKS